MFFSLTWCIACGLVEMKMCEIDMNDSETEFYLDTILDYWNINGAAIQFRLGTIFRFVCWWNKYLIFLTKMFFSCVALPLLL